MFYFKTAEWVLRLESTTNISLNLAGDAWGILFYYSESYDWDEYFIVLVPQQSLMYIIKL